MNQASTLLALTATNRIVQSYFELDLEDQLDVMDQLPEVTDEVLEFLENYQCEAPENCIRRITDYVMARKRIDIPGWPYAEVILN
ncbi:MAG: hypothetical protein KDD36_06745 [Flavobacteriales bacterium]|nr:hypothetical protein [Flavobacteriales bacterium]